MKQLLIGDKIPYFLSVLMALMAFQINNIIKIQLDAPTISYRYKVINHQQIAKDVIKQDLECELENIGNTKAFRDIVLEITFSSKLDTPKYILKPKIVAVAPSTIVLDTLWDNIEEKLNVYNIPVIQPNAKYILKLSTLQNINIDEYPKLYFTSKDDVRLKEYGFEIFLAKNQILINWILLFTWIICIITYLYFLQKTTAKV